MRAITDILDSLTTTVRVIVGLFTLAIVCFGLMMTFGASYVAPAAIEGIAEKAIEANEVQTAAALRARRERELAKDGWGYSSDDDFAGSSDHRKRSKDDWAAD